MILLVLASAFLAGVFFGVKVSVSAPALGLFVAAALMLAVLLISLRRTPLPAFLALLLALGMLQAEFFRDDRVSALEPYHSQRAVQLQGWVLDYPEAAGSALRFRLAVDHIGQDDRWVSESGDMLVTLRESIELAQRRNRPYIRYGDRLLLDGVLQAPPVLEGFDYPAFLARQGIGSVMAFPDVTLLDENGGRLVYRWLYGARLRLTESLAEVVPEPQASLGQALLLGLRDNLPEGLVDDFRATGTSHLLAISGLHVAVVLGLRLAASQWVLGRRRQYYLLVPLVLVWLYALMSGLSPSVVRAATMGTVYLAAHALGRPRSVLPTLGLAAALMVAVTPTLLWDVSFQLSFTAIGGIAVMAEPVAIRLRAVVGVQREDATAHRSPMGLLADAVAVTIAATMATLPLVAFYFGRVSLVGLPGTLLALPALPFVLVSHATAGLLGLAATWLALPIGWLAWVATAYITVVVGLLARVPGASFETGQIAPFLVWTYYGFFILLLGRGALRPAASRTVAFVQPLMSSLAARRVRWWALAPALSLAALVWIAALSLPDGRLHVTFADVGQGDAVFITTPGGAQIMVDGGPDPVGATRLVASELGFWDRSIDLVVLTHPHSDHVAGLTEVLRRYDVSHVLERETTYESSQYTAWRRVLGEEDAIVTQAQAGQLIALGDGVSLQVIPNPPKDGV